MPPKQGIRDTLFGDLPLNAFPPPGADGQMQEPWLSFVRARKALAAGAVSAAVDIWRRIAAMRDLESRQYAQAWHFLRMHGVEPSADLAKTLLGVVVEVSIGGGLDMIAAYADHTARYFNFSGAGVIWERSDDSLDPAVDALLETGRQVLQQIGPWTEPRPPAPPPGHMRLNLLSPAGLHFGQGPIATLAADPLAKPAVDTATALMQLLIKRSSQSSESTDTKP
jgi:hypothetical protein